MRVLSQFKEKMKLVALQQQHGEIVDAIATAETVHQLCQVMKSKEANNHADFSFLPLDNIQSKYRDMKNDMIRLKQDGVRDQEIGERMLEKYGGKDIPGIETGGDLSWEATAKRLSEENKRLEQELKRSEADFMEEYEERQEEG